jgi:exonuclease 1
MRARYIEYCMGRVKLLQEFGIIPVIVFDGGNLPAKKREEGRRHWYVS